MHLLEVYNTLRGLSIVVLYLVFEIFKDPLVKDEKSRLPCFDDGWLLFVDSALMEIVGGDDVRFI